MQGINLKRISEIVREAKDLPHVRLTVVKQTEIAHKRKEIFFQINKIRTTHDLTYVVCRKITGYNFCTFVWVKNYHIEKISSEKALEVLERLKNFVHLKDKHGLLRAVSICENEVRQIRESRIQPGSCCSNSPKELEIKKMLFTYFQNLTSKQKFSVREIAAICNTTSTTIHNVSKSRYGKISIKTLSVLIERFETRIS